jgi:hypothetical protein
MFRGAAEWMANNLAEHELVLNLAWGDFPDLFYNAPRQDYVWGVSPNLSLWFAPERTVALDEMTTGHRKIDFPWLAREFNARYAIISRKKLNSGEVRPWIAYQDDDSLILDMRRPVVPPSESGH